jgi:hypothetical protein
MRFEDPDGTATLALYYINTKGPVERVLSREGRTRKILFQPIYNLRMEAININYLSSIMAMSDRRHVGSKCWIPFIGYFHRAMPRVLGINYVRCRYSYSRYPSLGNTFIILDSSQASIVVQVQHSRAFALLCCF